MDEKLVFCDLEAAGLDATRHPPIQIAAIAVDAYMTELETFEVKVRFDIEEADAVAPKKYQYSPELWNRRAREPLDAAHAFARFLRRHATVDLFANDGRRYQVAQLVAHNAERFDAPFLQAWFDRLGVFLPARYMALCTKQRALWLFDEDKTLTPPANFQLGTLCEFFGVSLLPENAHDALCDVRATVDLYRAMRDVTEQRRKEPGGR